MQDSETHIAPQSGVPLEPTAHAVVGVGPPDLGLLLRDPPAKPLSPRVLGEAYENHLVEVRLGIAGSLFAAIRHKHAPTAAHCLRVALGCSSWAFSFGLTPEERDELEVASLLHDVGKIGVPDRLLFKPGTLARDELRLVDKYRRTGLNILTNCCDSPGVLEIIRHSGAWYNGTRSDYALAGDEIPLGARMLAIVDAFDSMTCDQVYRRAMPRERAIHELFRHAGTQFDPQLVKSFGELQVTVQLDTKVVSHWLKSLDAGQSNRFWRGTINGSAANTTVPASIETLFQQKLIENMYDAVIFVNSNLQITHWNRAAERLTGIAASSILERTWSPTLIGMRDETIGGWAACQCPVAHSMETGVQSLRRLLVADRNHMPVAVDVHTIPIVGQDGFTRGATMVLHDATGEASLEERCQALQEKATKDSLTDLANRAEFDQAHQLFIQAHLERRVPCSTIICDIDHFKNINDTFGHQAGDEVLQNFARMLKRECRPGDLVARYGGEEFVVLCADCTNAAAARRAEEMRKLASQLSEPALNGREFTVSFGVTEIQAGDTPESMLRRADRALLEAKRSGRNTVVQLGGGLIDDAGPEANATKLKHDPHNELFVERLLITAVPLNIAVEKLRGFVLDHHAEILAVNSDCIDLEISTVSSTPGRRRSDRPIPFLVSLSLSEVHIPSNSVDGRVTGEVHRTHTKVSIRLKRSRDRRKANVAAQADAILAAIRSYLMAIDETEPAEPTATRHTTSVLAPWLKLRG